MKWSEVLESFKQKDERIAELEKENFKLLELACDIQQSCIGEIAMNYKIDAAMTGEMIYSVTGMTAPVLCEHLKSIKADE